MNNLENFDLFRVGLDGGYEHGARGEDTAWFILNMKSFVIVSVLSTSWNGFILPVAV